MVLQESKSAIKSPMTAILTVTPISQRHLHAWETCRRKYRYSFLEDLSLPEADLQRQRTLLLGSNFHLLMQQRELGLDVSALASSDRKLQSWLDAFESQPPKMLDGERLCEHRRTLEIAIAISNQQDNNCDRNCFVLTAIYDFLILGEHTAQILDWKTHQIAIAAEQLKNNWQTCLYLYLLAKTTNYSPDQLSMTYWFANTAESVIINYSQSEYERTERRLQQILTEITKAGDDFDHYPKVALGSDACNYCEFRDRCDRGEVFAKVTTDITEISEVEI